MRCDDVRKSATEGEPLDAEARGHLASCASCGEEFPELRDLTAPTPPPPSGLRDRVLAAFPVRRPSPWAGLARAAAMLLIGLVGGFIGGFISKPAEKEIVYRDKPVPTDKAPSDDLISNIGIAGQHVYGKERVEIDFDDQIHVVSIRIDPKIRDYEQFCPVARQLGSLAQKRPDLVAYKKKDY